MKGATPTHLASAPLLMPGCGHCWHGPEPELQISLGTHENMPDRMSEYKSVSEPMSDRMPVGGDHSKTVCFSRRHPSDGNHGPCSMSFLTNHARFPIAMLDHQRVTSSHLISCHHSPTPAVS